jgi:formamidopyrimidine-DNA glycosylase
VSSVDAKGKFMYWTFDNGWYLFSTFGMTGQWSPEEGKHPCLIVQFEGGSEEMVFNDPRHFGTIKFVHGKKLLDNKLFELGWDPLQMPLSTNLAWVKWHLAKTGKGIGEVLMDQGVFAGVGNYIRAEALYLSRLSPFRPANTLSEDESHNLCQCIVDVMEESYEHQGATIQTYKTVYGEEGKYSSLFKVYGKKKGPCGNAVVKQDSGGRSIHWCPAIQI